MIYKNYSKIIIGKVTRLLNFIVLTEFFQALFRRHEQSPLFNKNNDEDADKGNS
jgi:hypothetical protein